MTDEQWACPKCGLTSAHPGTCPRDDTRRVEVLNEYEAPVPRDPYVACSMCTDQVPGRVVPVNWAYHPNGTVVCDQCAKKEAFKMAWYHHKNQGRRRRR